jgi:HemY protein
MTKLAIRLTLVFALAVTLAIAGTVSNGYVMLVVAHHRIELSFNLFVVLLLLGYGVFHLLARAVAFVIALPERARNERAASDRQRAQSSLLRSVLSGSQGAYAQAEKQAVEAAKQSDFKAAAMVLAGQAALLQSEAQRAQQYFEQAKGNDEVIDIARQVGLAQSLVQRNQWEAALTPLRDALNRDGAQPKALSLRLSAYTALQRWDDALNTIKEMRRAKVATPTELYAHEMRLHRSAMDGMKQDAGALSTYWYKLSDDAKRDVELMLQVVDWLLALGAKGEARAMLETALPTLWDSRLAQRYGDTAEGNSLSQIEKAERWLLQYPKDASLLVSLAKLCFAQGLWGKAQSYLDASAALSARVDSQIILPSADSVDTAATSPDHQRTLSDNIARIQQSVQQLRAQIRERLVLSTLGT